MATAGAAEPPQSLKAPMPKMVVGTVFAPVGAAPWAQAVTYNTELVPVGGWVQVKEELRRSGGTRIELRVRDLAADRVYGAHVHTNEDGSARSTAIVDWRFREGGARSVVLHEMATSTHEGHAGTAGARLACVNVPFM